MSADYAHERVGQTERESVARVASSARVRVVLVGVLFRLLIAPGLVQDIEEAS